MKYKHKIADVNILRKINNNLSERNLLQPFEKVLITVSGGQDSICLLRIFYDLEKKWAWRLGIVHCDHRWNPNSIVQSKHIAKLATSMQIDYYQAVAIEPVMQETVARHWRYQILQTIAIDHGYTAVVTAHSASDRIETLIYNLIRGSGLEGIQSLSWKRELTYLRDIPWENWMLTKRISYRLLKYEKSYEKIFLYKNMNSLQLIRPLLDLTRTEIRNLLNDWSFPAWPDPSNRSVRISRNRIRHRLVPYIRLHYNPQFDQALAKWSEIVNAENIYLTRLTYSILAKVQIHVSHNIPKIDSHGMSIPLLRSFPLVFQRRVLRKFIYEYIGKNLSFDYIEHIRLYCLGINSSVYSLKKKNRKDNLNFPCLFLPGEVKLVILDKIILCVFNI